MITLIGFYFQGETYLQGDSYLLDIAIVVSLGGPREKSVGVLSPCNKGKFVFLLLLIIRSDLRLEVLLVCCYSSFPFPIKRYHRGSWESSHGHIRWADAGQSLLQFLYSAAGRRKKQNSGI